MHLSHVLKALRRNMGGCQNSGPPIGSPKYWVPYYAKDPKKDHNFDNHPYVTLTKPLFYIL